MILEALLSPGPGHTCLLFKMNKIRKAGWEGVCCQHPQPETQRLRRDLFGFKGKGWCGSPGAGAHGSGNRGSYCNAGRERQEKHSYQTRRLCKRAPRLTEDLLSL